MYIHKNMVASIIFVAGLLCPTKSTPISYTKLAKPLVGIAGVAATARALYNYAELRLIQMRGRSDHILFGDEEDAPIRMINWRRDQWPSARDIQEHREDVKRELCNDIVNGVLVLFDGDGNQVAEPTWGDIGRLIEAEMAQLKNDLNFLEKKHIVYYTFLSPLLDPKGLLHDIKVICREEGVDPYGLSSVPREKEKQIEARIQALCTKKRWHLFRPNYGKAARIYWREYKLYRRLQALLSIVDGLSAGTDDVNMPDVPAQYEVVHSVR